LITLYELHWSHYCEKIRLALAYAGLPWQTCDIHAFSKKELLVFPLPPHMSKRTVPAIFDTARGELVMDSMPILRYLCKHYPQMQSLYQGDAGNQEAIDAMLIELDTKLGLLARRFGYTQVILECPSLLSILFLSRAAGGFFTLPGVRWIAGHILGMVLCQRFALHQSESSHLYEALESYLLQLARRLEARTLVVGDTFSMTDLALAAYLRPLSIVPFFYEHHNCKVFFPATVPFWLRTAKRAYRRIRWLLPRRVNRACRCGGVSANARPRCPFLTAAPMPTTTSARFGPGKPGCCPTAIFFPCAAAKSGRL
jgi:glutathione S-transferase